MSFPNPHHQNLSESHQQKVLDELYIKCKDSTFGCKEDYNLDFKNGSSRRDSSASTRASTSSTPTLTTCRGTAACAKFQRFFEECSLSRSQSLSSGSGLGYTQTGTGYETDTDANWRRSGNWDTFTTLTSTNGSVGLGSSGSTGIAMRFFQKLEARLAEDAKHGVIPRCG